MHQEPSGTTFGYGGWCIEGLNLGRDPSVAAAVRGGLRDARGGVGSGEGAANAAVIGLRGDEAIHDPGGGREGGGGDGFAVQAGHGVIVSIGDALRACQAVVFGFRDIGREPAVLPFSARTPEDASPKGKCPPPNFRRWAWMSQLAQDFKSPSEMVRRATAFRRASPSYSASGNTEKILSLTWM